MMMPRIRKLDFKTADSKTRNLVQRMSRFDLHDRIELIANTFGNIVFRTGFSLADQVLTHALVSARLNVSFIKSDANEKPDANLASLQQITADLYGLRFDDRIDENAEIIISADEFTGKKSGYIGKDAQTMLIQVNPVSDWSYEELVQYVLDHEVPVNPADMPGKDIRAA